MLSRNSGAGCADKDPVQQKAPDRDNGQATIHGRKARGKLANRLLIRENCNDLPPEMK
jgi:hypothetical protein